MALGKLGSILSDMYTQVESLTPFYDSTQLFARYSGLDDLQQTDPSQTFRAFRITPVRVEKGSLQSTSTKRCKKALVQISVNYPIRYFSESDTDFLGVESIRADDDMLIVNKFCFTDVAPAPTVSDVRSVQWLGSSLSGRLWVIALSIEYLETL